MATDRTANVFFSLQVPGELVDALAGLQRDHQDRVEPQQHEHIHITLGFLHDADAPRLADAAALVSGRSWPAPAVGLSGEIRHGSWQLQKNPSYRHDEDLVQKQEQIRLGVEPTPELTEIHQGITQELGIAEDGFWPHVTLGLAREDFPVNAVKEMTLPSARPAAPSLNLQQELTATDFRVLVRKTLR